MTRIKSILPALLLSALAGPLWAGSYTAASCNISDVNAVTNGPTHIAVAGDTIVIPAGTCTWTTGLSISVGITLTGTGTPNVGPSTFGSGTLSTIIIDNARSSNPLIYISGAGYTYGQTFTVALMDIEPASSSTALYSPISVAGTCTSSGCPLVRVDNIGFGITTRWTETGNGAQATSMIRCDNVFGVFDHNTVPNGSDVTFYNNSLSAYLGVGAYGDSSWAQPDSFGDANNIFAENNIVYTDKDLSDQEFAATGGGIGGGRQVGRFNQITLLSGAYASFTVHGLDTGGRNRSGRTIEAYRNTITCTGGGCSTATASFRGGTGLVWGNTITANYPVTGGFFNAIANITVYRTVYAPSPWGGCGGSSPYDTNDGNVYYSGTMTTSGSTLTMTDASKSWTTNQLAPSGAPYSVYDTTQGFWAQIVSNTSETVSVQAPISESGWTGFNSGDSYQILRATICADSGGRGAGGYVSGATPTPASPLNQALDPTYEFMNSFSGSLNQGVLTTTDAGNVIANRNYYTETENQAAQTSTTSPFNGTSGNGHGTLANRPTTCTKGVGYFATDQGSWNQSGIGGQGELFVCASTSQWRLYYTPYTYPHPLTEGTGGSTGLPLGPPTNLQAIAK